MSVTDWLLLINGTCVALSTGIVFVVTRLRRQLDVIHKDTNGNLTALKLELAQVRSQLQREVQR